MKIARMILVTTAVTLALSLPASAQMGMMGGNMPEDIRKMMQEQNKALAQASIQYMGNFTRCLHTQAKERRDQIDDAFIKSAFSEMKRAYEMIQNFQGAHVRTMDGGMQSKVQPMMERMNRNLAAMKNNLEDLEKEVNGTRELDRISHLTGDILKRLEDMPGTPGGMAAPPQGKPGMMRN
ncbi:MAG TPA: hypothetical protein VLS90_20760 [Thermodesulfobacteriota bacterium]|nr:hypothetical protein [Thermodesulfobacteriota bacterium]